MWTTTLHTSLLPAECERRLAKHLRRPWSMKSNAAHTGAVRGGKFWLRETNPKGFRRVVGVLRGRFVEDAGGTTITCRIVAGLGDTIFLGFILGTFGFLFIQALLGLWLHHGNANDDRITAIEIPTILVLVGGLLLAYNIPRMRADRDVLLNFLRRTLNAT